MDKNRLCYEYRELLRDYLESPAEMDLYHASLMGKDGVCRDERGSLWITG